MLPSEVSAGFKRIWLRNQPQWRVRGQMQHNIIIITGIEDLICVLCTDVIATTLHPPLNCMIASRLVHVLTTARMKRTRSALG
jgi:hypothetical protein